ncbi:MAG: imidazole glycerol phosphate synthase subunit HisH [Actinomycetota bacterium]
MREIAVLDYGLGNLRSVARAIERVGGRAVVTADAATAMDADALVLPGVGAFGACMRNVRERGFEPVIMQAAAAGRPVLGVCLGLQILFDGSDEADEAGLGVIPGRVERLPSSVKVPHMGWNEVGWTRPHPVADRVPSGNHFYFGHSFAVPADNPATVGTAEHGRPFAAAVAAGSVLATQFHPEKSGQSGLAIYEWFVRQVKEVAA